MSYNGRTGVGGRIWQAATNRPFFSSPRFSYFHTIQNRQLSTCPSLLPVYQLTPRFSPSIRLPTIQSRPFDFGSKPSIIHHATLIWARSVHGKSCKGKRKRNTGDRRNKSSVTNGAKHPVKANNGSHATPRPVPSSAGAGAGVSQTPRPPPREHSQSPQPPQTQKPSQPQKSEEPVQSTPNLLDRLPQSLHGYHRPTKEELLAAATGFWSRLKVRFKWVTIKSVRPFNIDEIGAFFSWILVGHVVWVILGTTTFFSLLIFLANTVFAQETLARSIGNYLTQSSGLNVVFESAIVPKWKDGVISFKKVFVSRRPGNDRSTVSKGSQTSAAAAAAAAAQQDRGVDREQLEEEDTNYTQFDVAIETVNVTLSFSKWWNGKGLLRDVEMKGVRGVVDRTHLQPPTEYIDPRSYKHVHNPGDFELDSFKLEDLLVTVYQPGGFRPFSVSIFSCDLPQLRKHHLFYDFMSASTMSGSFDNSLFTVHPRQTHNYTESQLIATQETGEGSRQWKKQSRVRIDGLNIDHLNRGVEGPFSWIHEGNVDIVADIMFPAEHDDSIAKVMSDFYNQVEASVTANGQKIVRSVQKRGEETHSNELAQEKAEPEGDNRFVIFDVRVNLNDVRAAVPLFTHDISYINNALIRPIVAYINSKRAFIPVNCRVVKRASEFDGSWTIYDSGLMDDLSIEMYEAFARDVLNNHQTRKRRIKKVGIWTLQLAAQALFIGLAGNIA